MNRLEFMRELERLLTDISISEREEALQYYNDYLNDAGVENEEEVIASLGSPEKVAATIKAGLSGGEDGAFTENGYQDYEEEKNTITVREGSEQYSEKHNEYENAGSDATNSYQPPAVKKERSAGAWVAIILLCLICAPVILAVGFGAVMTLLGLLIALLAIVFAAFVTVASLAFALLVTGIVLVGVGFAKMFGSPLGGTLLIAGGALCLGMGFLFLALTVWVVGKAIPAVIRFIVRIISGLFRKKGGAKA